MLKKLHGRKLAVCLIGGAMYALFSAFGWQAEHGGVIWAGGALLVAALLVWPIAALLAVLPVSYTHLDVYKRQPQVGLEPTTLRLTAECSAIELLRNISFLITG